MPGEIICALEDTYGEVPDTGWQSNGVNTDSHKTKQQRDRRKVIKRRTAAPSAFGDRISPRGGEGVIDLDGTSSGLGIYFACAASSAESAVVLGGTDAFEQVFEWGVGGVPAGRSLAASKYVELPEDAGDDVFDFPGGKRTQVEIGQSLDGFLNFKFTMDYGRPVVRLTGGDLTAALARDIEVVVPSWVYNWQDALITLTPKTYVDGEWVLGSPVSECLSSFNVTLPGGLNTERWCLKRGTLKHEPTQESTPEPSGTLAWDYEHATYYDAFVSGQKFQVTADWLAPEAIEDATFPSLTINLGTIGFHEANDPELSEADATKQSAPFEVLDDETGDAPASITIVTTDDIDLSLGS